MNTSNSKKPIIILVLGTLFLLFLFLVLRPVPPALEKNCYQIKGQVAEVESPCCQDIFISLANDKHRYYINRGLERGLDLGQLQKTLIGQEVKLKVIKRNWTPLDFTHLLAPVAALEVNNEVVFSSILTD